jgi:cytochrome c oxidase subunit 2
MAIAIVLILLVIGSLVFHLLSPWWFTPLASNWGMIDTTVDITFWVTGVVFVAVNLFLAYCVVRFRHRAGQKADYDPENTRLEWSLTIVTSIGVAAMLAPGLFVWAKFVQVPDDAATVEAVGQQWAWSYRFPGRDGVFGTTSARLMTSENPFGVNPDDPKGQDDVLIDNHELHLPLDKPIHVLLRSKDVLHNFTVPQFRVKMDLVPGLVTSVWLTPTRVGRFDILCEELCGLAHFAMRGAVIVEPQQSFDTWLATQPTFAQTVAHGPGDAAAGQASYQVCAACHGADGQGNAVLHAPKLAGQEGWYLKRQLQNYKHGVRGAHEEDIWGRQMAPMAATLVDEATLNNVIAYIRSLPDTPAPSTIAGDVDRGQEIYTTCSTCHGAQGQGVWSVNAPRQAGMNDWYMVQQLQNFRRNIRGGHPQDGFGKQMAEMAKILATDQAINDVVAYINTLRPPARENAVANAVLRQPALAH